MKTFKYTFALLLSFCAVIGAAQEQRVQVSDTVEISFLYNVVITFDSPLEKDPFFGSTIGILWEKIDDQSLMVKVNGQAMLAKEASSIPNTNMTVRTSTALYNFILTYKKQPSRFSISPGEYLPVQTYGNRPKLISRKQNSDSLRVADLLAGLMEAKPYFNDIGLIDSKLRMKMEVTNIWVDSLYTYVKIVIQNQSSIPYDINYFRYVISLGKIHLKRTSDPINQLTAVYQYSYPVGTSIRGGDSFSNVICFKKFTLNKNEYFNIQVGEVNGARQITVPIGRKQMFEARGVGELE
ncbi:MAG TPA: DUF4138 domain-containing protein [Cyclobacteriaceae bacterium]|nr:DUF4138 domain-containing protein [Cyclobacteriaceae bacterium]